MGKRTAAVEIEGVRLTSPDRVLFEGQGITKRDLVEYYRAVADRILPHLEGRPLTLVRCPRGRAQQCFVQRKAGAGVPEAVPRVEVGDGGSRATYLMVDSLPALLSLVQLGVLELHVWSARRDRLDRPDRMILDLDPGPGLSFAAVREAAHLLRGRLEELGLRSFVKTSGGKGLHLVVPLARRHPWEETRAFARALAEEAERGDPARFVAEAAKSERSGRVFVDYLRNAWSASAVAAYSTRAHPGAPVSTPLSWRELDGLERPQDLSVATVPGRLAALREDPWEGFAGLRQTITRRMRERVGLG
jgi:bifunctional non-homologous end joining protein LigD